MKNVMIIVAFVSIGCETSSDQMIDFDDILAASGRYTCTVKIDDGEQFTSQGGCPTGSQGNFFDCDADEITIQLWLGLYDPDDLQPTIGGFVGVLDGYILDRTNAYATFPIGMSAIGSGDLEGAGAPGSLGSAWAIRLSLDDGFGFGQAGHDPIGGLEALFIANGVNLSADTSLMPGQSAAGRLDWRAPISCDLDPVWEWTSIDDGYYEAATKSSPLDGWLPIN